MKTLQKKIMRGIYYAYAIRLVTIPGLWQGFVMLGTMIILTHFVSLGNVINNLSQIEMSHIDTFVYNAVRTTEIWTLLLIGLFVFFSLSLRFTLTPRERQSLSLART
jgi:hypothetical protein